MPTQPMCNETSWVYLGSASEAEGDEGDCGDDQDDFSCLLLQFSIVPFQVGSYLRQTNVNISLVAKPWTFCKSKHQSWSFVRTGNTSHEDQPVKVRSVAPRKQTCSHTFPATPPLFSASASSCTIKNVSSTPGSHEWFCHRLTSGSHIRSDWIVVDVVGVFTTKVEVEKTYAGDPFLVTVADYDASFADVPAYDDYGIVYNDRLQVSLHCV